jgi:hypothetical protein
MSAEDSADATLANRAQPDPPADSEALTVEIERTREELGGTVEALMAKVDVKARARERVADVARRLPERVGQRRVPVLVGVGAALVAGWLLLRRRRR